MENKKIFIIILTVVILSILFIPNSKATSAGISLTASNNNPTVGESVTVTATATAGGFNLTLSGNGETKQIVGQTDTTDNVSKSVSITFTPKEAQTYTFYLNGDYTDYYTDSETSVDNKSISITAKSASSKNENDSATTTPTSKPVEPKKPAEKSNVATLSNLGITPNDFKGFSASKYSYDVDVPMDVEKIEIYAYKGQNGQKIEGTGSKSLKEGLNKFEIKVTAEDGKNTKTYTLNITRKEVEKEHTEEQENVGLSKIVIKGLTLNPEFKSDVYEYKTELTDNLECLDIEYEAANQNAKVEISGNENLVEGENVITIFVKEEDEAKNVEYKINVEKKIAEQTEEAKVTTIGAENNEKLPNKAKILIVAVGAELLLVLVLCIMIIHKLRHRYDDDDYYYEDEDEEDDIIKVSKSKKVENKEIDKDDDDEIYERKPRSKGRRFK